MSQRKIIKGDNNGMAGNSSENFDPVSNIAYLSQVFKGISGASNFKIIAGIGADDCGAFSFNGTQFVVSTDFINASPIMLDYGGTHFDLGKYLVNVNLSDCLSSGAYPLTFLSNLMFKRDTKDKDFISLVDGMHHELNRRNVPLLGGDTKIGKVSCFSGTIIGYSDKKLFLQSNAKLNDDIWCSGLVGGVATSLLGLSNSDLSYGIFKNFRSQLIENLVDPTLEFEKSMKLINSGKANAGTDLSDGLLSDLGCICKNSGCGAQIDIDKIPVSETTVAISNHFDYEGWMLPLVLGGDLQFILTSPTENASFLESLGFYKIGKIVQSAQVTCVRGDVTFNVPFIGHNDAYKGGFYEELIYHLEIVNKIYHEVLN